MAIYVDGQLVCFPQTNFCDMLWSLIPHLTLAAAQVVIPSPVEHTGDVDACQGYVLKVTQSDCGLDGELTLKGKCGAFGPDYEKLKLTVRHDNDDRLRVHIADAEGKAHVVPDDVVQDGWPKLEGQGQRESNLQFDYTEDPFTFKVTRKSDGEVIFDTSGQALIFEEQYVRVKSALAEGSNIQGAAQSSDNFTLPITEEGYVRTLWNRDAYGVPARTNLYGSHPIIVNQKVGENPSASGVFLLNSNGMDIKFPEQGKYIEYNTLGGIADFFFLNGPTPADVSRQAAAIWKPSPMVPYWSLGFHSCRYGYEDIFEVAEVIANYSAAGIPLQTQWMDIDYMYERWIMTLDPPRFALDKVQYVIDHLHNNSMQFIVMVDPATFSGMPSLSAENYEAFQSGLQQKAFLAYDDGNIYQGVVWPGPTVFPDWTAEGTQGWWDSEFMRFFNTETGVNIDGIWLDMNEAANFLPHIEVRFVAFSVQKMESKDEDLRCREAKMWKSRGERFGWMMCHSGRM